MKKTIICFSVLALLTGACAFSQAKPQPVENKTAQAVNEFGFRLFLKVASGSSGNVLVSPTSVSTALAMAYNGAGGTTRTAMAKTLGMGSWKTDEVNQGFRALSTSLNKKSSAWKLSVANSMWARQGIQFRQDFISRNRSWYGAEARTLDFNNPRSVNIINGWISDHTGGMIKDALQRISGDDIMFLVNAVYFHGSWDEPFKSQYTKKAPFHLSRTKQKSVQMMNQWGEFVYYRGQGFQAVRLPYSGKRFSMVVVLPEQNSGLAGFYKNLNAANWDKWMGKFSEKEGHVGLPRFTFRTTEMLNKPLSALGMGEAFTRKADFSGMLTGQKAWIGYVKHDAVVKVDEKGTEAAASTIIAMNASAAPAPQEPFDMVMDRPFFFAIRDNNTGAVLFAGAVANP